MNLDKMKHEYIKDFKNIRIRPLREDDLELLRIWRNNPDNCKYLSKIPYITSAMQKGWFESTFETPNEYVFAIEEICELNRLVGSLSLYNITEKEAEFGKILIGNEEAHGKKIGVNSLNALLLLCFNELDLNSVYLHVYEDNVGAIKVYSQVGFSVEEEHIAIEKNELIMSISRNRFLSKEEQ